MSVPDYQSLMLPVLKALADGIETPTSTVRERVALTEGLTSEDIATMLPSGLRPVFTNRVSWAIVHMSHAGLVERVRRGVYRLTTEGRDLLSQPPERIDLKLLRTYPAYEEWRNQPSSPKPDDGETPEEALERNADQLNRTLEADVLDRVRNGTPAFFEQVVVDLLIAMGYGGGDAKKGRVTGKSGDGGIDGVIQEDSLGLDEVYVQAKKYDDNNTVGESALRNFAGAIDAAGTTKGVFVTTSAFTRAAQDYVARSPKRIVLIDGEKLARLMVQHDIGTRTQVRYEIKRIDEDYFGEEAV